MTTRIVQGLRHEQLGRRRRLRSERHRPSSGGRRLRPRLSQNSPRSNVVIGKNRDYWMSRLKAMGWATVWSPTRTRPRQRDVVRQPGWIYLRARTAASGCRASTTRSTPSLRPPTPAGLTSLSLHSSAPHGYWAKTPSTSTSSCPSRATTAFSAVVFLRSALEPSRSFAAIFAGRFPWELPAPENNFVAYDAAPDAETANSRPSSAGRSLGSRHAVQQSQPSGAEQRMHCAARAARTCRARASISTTTSPAASPSTAR